MIWTLCEPTVNTGALRSLWLHCDEEMGLLLTLFIERHFGISAGVPLPPCGTFPDALLLTNEFFPAACASDFAIWCSSSSSFRVVHAGVLLFPNEKFCSVDVVSRSWGQFFAEMGLLGQKYIYIYIYIINILPFFP